MSKRVPTFETQRLILRDFTESDIPSYQQNFADYEVIRNLSNRVPWPYPEDGVETFLNNFVSPTQGKDQWFWVITLKDEPTEAIGCVHLWREERPEQRGFWLARKHWGKGLMTEAVKPVMDYAFKTLRFEKLVFGNAQGNLRSRRIKEKTAARLLRVQPMKFVDPSFTEVELWELRKDEWENPPS
jgi:ribosomal-protein-alanine N-acetyltransferase